MKYHVVKIANSGLGDAIKATLAGAFYSEVSGRCLMVDWRNSCYSNTDENPFYSLFDLQNIQSCSSIPDNLSTNPAAWEKRLSKNLREVYVDDGRS